MLTLLLGRAGRGKTGYLFGKIAEKAAAGEPGQILIVPEQYSHDAERALAEVCGDRASLFAEVLSFSRLENRVFAQTGGMAEKALDKGGRLLAMSLAMAQAAPGLRVYDVAGRRPEFLESLVAAYDELRSSRLGADSLRKASESAAGPLSDKLSDLAVIFETFDAVKEHCGRDARDRMERLADEIGLSGVGCGGAVWVDGFTDFTAQEMRVLSELLKKGTDMTVCLTCGGMWDEEAVFALPVRTARELMAEASKRGVRTEILNFTGGADRKAPEIRFLEENLFAYPPASYEREAEGVELWSAADVPEECALAASRIVALLRRGYRMRDIAVVSPAWDRYGPTARGVFEKYGLAVNWSEKSDILQKPAMAFVTSALDIISENFDYVNVFRFLKTGLAGVPADGIDELENYVLKWNIRGEARWRGEWRMPPGGYSDGLTEADEAALARINALREKIVPPLCALRRELSDAADAAGKVRAVYAFLERAGLYEALGARAEALAAEGKRQLADEYLQLWDILVNALEETADILGAAAPKNDEFRRLLRLVLSQYEVGAIPSSADAVGAGDMKRMRGRGVKCLIVLGASDDALPAAAAASGIFSDGERETLLSLGLKLRDSGDDALSRELGEAYSSLTLPSDYLMLSCPSAGSVRRSYLIPRIASLLNIRERRAGEEIFTEAELPCFELAASGTGPLAAAARDCLGGLPAWAEKLEAARRAASMPRGRLSSDGAKRLYGRDVNLTASRVDRFYSCKFSYFLRYGLGAEPRRGAALDAPETGTFMHWVLQNTVRDAEAEGGFGKVSEQRLRELVRKYSDDYAERKLGGLEDKSGRFRYLFRRLRGDAESVVRDMSEELRNSDFRPLDFELRFAGDGELPPAEVTGNGARVRVSGAVDRVDGWVKGDDLYLRVVDYKTGRKAFSLSDVWYGMGLQMLIYLFALEKSGSARYGKNIVPAGVLYEPARDVMVSAGHDLDDEALEAERRKSIQRSGLLLDDPEVVEAMEHAGGRAYLPVKFTKDGMPTGENLATLERLGKLGKRVDESLLLMAGELRGGNIAADPYFRSGMDNACLTCDYYEACRFGTGDDRYRYLSKLKTPEAWEKIGEAEK